jgi:large conductance mechanosensitive channel
VIKEFRDFVTRGNLVELAVAFVMGIAFAAVVTSLTENVVMPIVAIPFGEPNFNALTWTVNDSVIAYGAFITAAVTFLLVALGVFFLIVKPINALRARQVAGEETAAEPPEDVRLLTEIRDELRRR